MGRPTIEEVLIDVAKIFGSRSTCTRAQVGAVAARDRRIIATGYVGSPSGQPHCLDVGCDMVDGVCVRTVHAEANLVAFSARVGVALYGSSIYATHSPCYACAKLLINAHIEELIFVEEYHDPRGLSLLHSAGIKARVVGSLIEFKSEAPQWP